MKPILPLLPLLLLLLAACADAVALPTPGGDRILGTCNLTASSPAWTRHTIYNTTLGTDGIDLADFDGDGDQDLVSAIERSDGEIVYCQNNGAGASWTCAEIDTLAAAEGAAIGDFDEDGNLDVCSTQQSPGRVRISFGPSSGRTTPANWTTIELSVTVGLTKGWMDCAAMDVDSDGETDILLGGDTGTATGTISWVKGPAAGKRTESNWTPLANIKDSGRTMSLWVSDYDADGDQDILESTRNTPNVGTYLHRKTGASTFSTVSISQNLAFDSGHVYMMFEPGDLDADGDLDVCNGTFGSVIRCHYNYSTFGFWVPHKILAPANFGEYQASAIGDLNKDGYPDLVLSSGDAATTESGLVCLLRNPRTSSGGPVWQRCEIDGIDAFFSKYDNVKLLDVDGDTDLDVIAGDQGDEDATPEGNEGISWLENPCK